ncbi:hypothetical protein D9M68_822890 [compost metagenome]
MRWSPRPMKWPSTATAPLKPLSMARIRRIKASRSSASWSARSAAWGSVSARQPSRSANWSRIAKASPPFSTPSAGLPSRPTCWRSMPPSRPRGRVTRDVVLPWWPRKFAPWPSGPRIRPSRSTLCSASWSPAARAWPWRCSTAWRNQTSRWLLPPRWKRHLLACTRRSRRSRT